jgi:hypothetical protein
MLFVIKLSACSVGRVSQPIDVSSGSDSLYSIHCCMVFLRYLYFILI